MNIKEALDWAKNELKSKSVEGSKSSAEFLLRQVLNVDKVYFFSHPEKRLTLFEERKFIKWVTRRAKHEPVWYITGKIEFCGQDFFVNQNVLIPRPETEILLEQVISKVNRKKKKEIKVLDLGTGSGAIILTLANMIFRHPEFISGSSVQKDEILNQVQNDVEFFASDISEKALRVAKKNAKSLGLAKIIKFKQGDLFGPWVGQKFDLIIANLPYIPHEEMSTLAFDITHFEPRTALDGGVKGIEIYKRFFDELPFFVNKGALIFCEIGHDQGKLIKKIVQKNLPKAKVEILNDYADVDRIVVIET